MSKKIDREQLKRTALAATQDLDGWDDNDRGRCAEDAARRREVGEVLAKDVVLS